MRLDDKKTFVETLLNQPKVRGRPRETELNEIRLDHNGKGRGYLIPIGDIHIGAETCNEQKLMETLEYAWEKKIPMIGMGDWMECGLSNSVGNSVYTQKINPQGQFDKLVELFEPFAKAGLLSGIHEGNHEFRISKSVGLDITKILAKTLGVRRFNDGQHHIIRCGNQSYTAWSHHGSSNARLPYTKIKAALDVARFVSAELIMTGHVHSLDTMTQNFYGVDKRTKSVVESRRVFVLTGHFLEYVGSYAAQKILVPSKTGVAKICFGSDNHDIHVSL